jgi:hypothetical protein
MSVAAGDSDQLLSEHIPSPKGEQLGTIGWGGC